MCCSGFKAVPHGVTDGHVDSLQHCVLCQYCADSAADMGSDASLLSLAPTSHAPHREKEADRPILYCRLGGARLRTTLTQTVSCIQATPHRGTPRHRCAVPHRPQSCVRRRRPPRAEEELRVATQWWMRAMSRNPRG